MALEAILDNLEGLSEPIAKEYKKSDTDDKYYLSVTPKDGWALEHVTGLKNSVESTRVERDTLDSHFCASSVSNVPIYPSLQI